MSAERSQDSVGIQGHRLRAGRLSLLVGIAIFAGKFTAYAMTGSSAVFADALESTINIVSAGMLLFALALAAKPPDRDHPYGHGRVEFLSAAIEGAAITVAALLIVSESIRELIQGPELASLDVGLAVLAGCSAANLWLGRHLVRVGHRTESVALIADGRHILSDVWTSAGVIAGLLIVRISGIVWIDPIVAIAVAVHVAREGAKLLRHSIGGLMDEADVDALDAVAEILERNRQPAWIDAHSLRSWRSGARRHFDLHLTVPRYFDVVAIHGIHDQLEELLLDDHAHGGDAVIHFDPCEPTHCASCRMPDCRVRSEAFRSLEPFTTEQLMKTDDQLEAPAA